MNDKRSTWIGKRWNIALFLVMVVIGAVIGYVVYSRGDRALVEVDNESGKESVAESGPRLSSEEAREAIELKDASIGHLENGPNEVEVDGRKVSSMQLAAEGFEGLTEELPSELLPLRNLAIARLLLLRNAQSGFEEVREVARGAAERFLEAAPDSGVARWLAAQVELQPNPTNPLAMTDESRERAVELLEQATELNSDSAVFWFALKQARTDQRAREVDPRAKEALEEAYQCAPRNIYLVTELLMVQAATEDEQITETLEAAREVFAPLVPAVQKRARIDLVEQIDAAISAVEAGQWSRVGAQVRILQNVVRPEEVAKSDIGRIDVHPLEFVRYEFSAEFYDRYGNPQPEFQDTTAVEFDVVESESLAELSEVRDIVTMDFTLDGLIDLLILQPGRLRVWSRSQGDLSAWREVAARDVPDGMQRVLAADLDRDRRKALSAAGGAEGADTGQEDDRFDRLISGTEVCHDADADIVVFGAAGVRVIRNDLNAPEDQQRLVLVENPGLEALTDVTAGLMFDLDHDGELDLAFSSAKGVTFWQAGAAFQFTDITRFSQPPQSEVPLTTMVAVDWDRDADIDVVASEPSGQMAGYLENLRHGEFRWTEFPEEYNQLGRPRDLEVLEADGNVSWDLLAAGPQGATLTLTSTPRSGVVNILRQEECSPEAVKGGLTWDFDNDGYRDAATWGEAGLQILRGGPEAACRPVDVVDAELAEPIEEAACVDIDRDGDQDLVAVTTSGVRILENTGTGDNGWITLYPLGQSDNKGRCNHHAIGSLVELRTGGWYQAQVVDSPAVHFGLGEQPEAQQLRIVWTNGVPQDLVNLAGDVAVCEPMALKGSCPYLYTMADGEFSFFTDCLWAAPIGMQTPTGTIAPTRSWEYLRIPGDRLTPHEGSYWLKFTEELWEAGYFDKVQLIVVDHPADVEVYSNEKVGPPDIAARKLHTVTRRRFPRSVVDQRGRDLAAKLRQRDGDFVKAFPQRIRQGLTPEHHLEIDLGEMEDPKEVILFLTGWIFPTDTSLNVAFSQDPETDGPKMPSVWVPDAEGNWQQTIAYMGFPGGKTKTIAVDLSDAFLAEDYRVRIKTTAEIYWDEVFFSVDEPEVEIRQIPLRLQSAVVDYHGFSAEIARPDVKPQMYDHNQVRRDPIWPPMRGKFTRYGPVEPLVTTADDQMVVLGAGDAMTVRFELPENRPPEGWKRDFLLYSVGYDKDADLNTIYGQTVGPLPFRAMKSYPYDPETPAPSGDDFEQYLRTYQTREQDPRTFWRKLLLDR